MARSRRVALAVCAALLAATIPAVALVPPVSSGPPTPIAHGAALSSQQPLLTFHGEMNNPTPLPTVSDPDPTLCVNQCDLWSLKVATHDPFLVSLHNGNSSIDDGFNLYVYDPAGNQVAASNGIGANGQAAAITPSSKGTYTVAVTMTYAYDAKASYDGEVRIMSRPTWDVPRCKTAKPCDVLPDLAVLPADDRRAGALRTRGAGVAAAGAAVAMLSDESASAAAAGSAGGEHAAGLPLPGQRRDAKLLLSRRDVPHSCDALPAVHE